MMKLLKTDNKEENIFLKTEKKDLLNKNKDKDNGRFLVGHDVREKIVEENLLTH